MQKAVDTLGHLPHPQMPMTNDMQQCIREARLDAFDSQYARDWYRNNELNEKKLVKISNLSSKENSVLRKQNVR